MNDMVKLSEKIACKVGAANLRVDWYYIEGELYFGELTLTHGNGIKKIAPPSFAIKMGNWISLPEQNKT